MFSCGYQKILNYIAKQLQIVNDIKFVASVECTGEWHMTGEDAYNDCPTLFSQCHCQVPLASFLSAEKGPKAFHQALRKPLFQHP